MRTAVHSVVVALRMLASPLEMRSSPHAIAIQGMTALVTAMNAKEPNRVREPSLKSGRPITFRMIASVRKPDADLKSSRTWGLMSCTATLMARNEPPQMKASPIRAKYGDALLDSDT